MQDADMHLFIQLSQLFLLDLYIPIPLIYEVKIFFISYIWEGDSFYGYVRGYNLR